MDPLAEVAAHELAFDLVVQGLMERQIEDVDEGPAGEVGDVADEIGGTGWQG